MSPRTRVTPEMALSRSTGELEMIDRSCVSCNTRMDGRPARALILRRPTQFTETADRVWLLSRNSFSVFHKLCRDKACRSFLKNPVLPPPPHPDALFEDSIYHRGTMHFLAGPVVERPWPVRWPGFCSDERSTQMRQFLKDESGFRAFLGSVDARASFRCVGCWSGQEEIDAVHHYACLFAQEASKESGIWMPYWFRDARLIGTNRVAYLLKGAESYVGAVMMDTLGYQTLAWVWLTPRLRGRGIFAYVWKQLEQYHGSFKVLAPLSKDMRSFLGARDPDGAHEIVTKTGATECP